MKSISLSRKFPDVVFGWFGRSEGEERGPEPDDGTVITIFPGKLISTVYPGIFDLWLWGDKDCDRLYPRKRSPTVSRYRNASGAPLIRRTVSPSIILGNEIKETRS